ncbi:hypothetical protein KQX54_002014 [Cotesia glomerata]|uniref:Uncharacterized protein n=1 Tax=Cotesia glomerata TaxID=32391 RepID=A0AAV7J1S0_COTGL|nr:hypothetical protein KQX54_002014 [Cotesia glomerata]
MAVERMHVYNLTSTEYRVYSTGNIDPGVLLGPLPHILPATSIQLHHHPHQQPKQAGAVDSLSPSATRTKASFFASSKRDRVMNQRQHQRIIHLCSVYFLFEFFILEHTRGSFVFLAIGNDTTILLVRSFEYWLNKERKIRDRTVYRRHERSPRESLIWDEGFETERIYNFEGNEQNIKNKQRGFFCMYPLRIRMCYCSYSLYLLLPRVIFSSVQCRAEKEMLLIYI